MFLHGVIDDLYQNIMCFSKLNKIKYVIERLHMMSSPIETNIKNHFLVTRKMCTTRIGNAHCITLPLFTLRHNHDVYRNCYNNIVERLTVLSALHRDQ